MTSAMEIPGRGIWRSFISRAAACFFVTRLDLRAVVEPLHYDMLNPRGMISPSAPSRFEALHQQNAVMPSNSSVIRSIYEVQMQLGRD